MALLGPGRARGLRRAGSAELKRAAGGGGGGRRPPAGRRGAGLENVGNTCFLNSVLQCLTYTPPLATALVQGGGGSISASCGRANCSACALRDLVRRSYATPRRTMVPASFVAGLPELSGSFRAGRQEDAHEYVRCLMERICEDGGSGPRPQFGGSERVDGVKKMPCTPALQIFGGRLRSRIVCTQCGHCSDTFEPMMDLSLECLSAGSLEEALGSFTAEEALDGENRYACAACGLKVRAVKRLTLEDAPQVLALQLKRFDPCLLGGKMDRFIAYPKVLDAGSFTSGGSGATYRLYAVLVHAGPSAAAGHYFCYARSPAGGWLKLDDDVVLRASERAALSQRAYILFYERQPGAAPRPGPSRPILPGLLRLLRPPRARRPRATPRGGPAAGFP